MQMLKKHVLNIVVLLSLCLSNNLVGLTLCEDTLKYCDDALTQTIKELDQMRKVDDLQEELIKKLATQRNEAYDRLSAEDKTPWYFWTILGIATGVIITRGLR